MYQAPSLALIASTAYEIAIAAAADPNSPQIILVKAFFISIPYFT